MTTEYIPTKKNFKFPKTSRYKNRTLFEEEGLIFYNTQEISFENLKNGENYYTISAAEENRLDIVAYRVYGDPNLWWLIAYANDIIDPFTELPAGTQLKIPDRTEVLTNI